MFLIIKKKEKSSKPLSLLDFVAETEGFEPSSLKGHHDFEQKAVSTAPPLSVPENCNISICSARN